MSRWAMKRSFSTVLFYTRVAQEQKPGFNTGFNMGLFRSLRGMYTIPQSTWIRSKHMAQNETFDFADQEQLREIIQYIEEPELPKPGTIKDAPLRDLGRVIELESEFLVVMPPNLALRMPKKDGTTLDSVRDQVISMVAMHVNVLDQE